MSRTEPCPAYGTPCEYVAMVDRSVEMEKEIARLRGALRTIDRLIPKSKAIATLPLWVATAGDVAEGALNGTWPAYGILPESAKDDE